MKNGIIASLASMASTLAVSAFAAELHDPSSPTGLQRSPMWTGVYTGLNAGFNFGTNAHVSSQNWGGSWTIPGIPTAILPGAAAASMNGLARNIQSGVVGGAQMGYNYQFGSSFLVGIEADIQGSSIGGYFMRGVASAARQTTNLGLFSITARSNATGTAAVQGSVHWLGTVRGRVGYFLTPTLLLYGSAGLAYGGAYADVTQTAIENISIGGGAITQANPWSGGGRSNQILAGWAGGGGVEWMFVPNWSLKAEALYWDMGRMNVQTVAQGASGRSDYLSNSAGGGRTSVYYSGVIARVGVNYHFSFGPIPVLSK